MGEVRLTKVPKECRPQGVRSRGRPKKKDGRRALMYTLSKHRIGQRPLFGETGAGLLRLRRRVK